MWCFICAKQQGSGLKLVRMFHLMVIICVAVVFQLILLLSLKWLLHSYSTKQFIKHHGWFSLSSLTLIYATELTCILD
jgi:hypothetical protein